MFQLLMPRRNRVSIVAALKQAISETALVITNVAAEFRSPAPLPAQPVEQTADPDDTYTLDDMPPLADIEAAASTYFRASEAARAADRQKRSAKKCLTRLASGVYGGWKVAREPSGRTTVDLEAVRATYKRLGLGDLPVKSPAPTLKVTRVVPTAAPVAGEFAALAGVAV